MEDNGRIPSVILTFSGKRKCGKDYVTSLLYDKLGSQTCCILRLSEPLKNQYAKDHSLDIERLLDATEYKERYRAAMIEWGESKRRADPAYFIRIVTAGPGTDRPVWIISDARRKSDIIGFNQLYPCRVVTVRVEADEGVRVERGWTFTSGIDDAESECGLDDGVFDVVINNSGNAETLDLCLAKLVADINCRLASYASEPQITSTV